ncbi:MAG: hypothetical protein ACYT04_55485 [Nostoc sp.]
MINRTQVFVKFDLNADQRDIFDRLTLAQQRRLIKVLETKQRTGKRRVIKATGVNKVARAKQARVLSDDSVGITQMYSSHLD